MKINWYERPMTPEEQAICDSYDARAREWRKTHPLTISERFDIGGATFCGVLAACFSGPWWWYAGGLAGGFGLVWILKAIL